MGLAEEGRANINKAFTRALFKCPETSQPSDTLLNKATVDVHGVILSHRWWPVWLLYIGMYIRRPVLGSRKMCIVISAWALALFVLSVSGNAKASGCRTSNKCSTHAFMSYSLPHSNDTSKGRGWFKPRQAYGRTRKAQAATSAYRAANQGRARAAGTNCQLVRTQALLRPLQCLQAL